MNRSRFPRMAALSAALFEQPLSNNYLTFAGVFILVGALLVYSEDNLPEIGKHLVMVATLVGIARLFSPRPLRWAWAGLVSLLSLVLLLDVAVLLI